MRDLLYTATGAIMYRKDVFLYMTESSRKEFKIF
jgi:hypothetical protein